MNRGSGSGSASLANKNNSLLGQGSSRGSTLVSSGKGLIESTPKGQPQPGTVQPSERSNILRRSANSQIANNKPKYSYHPSKPTEQSSKVGEFVTKEARLEQAQQVKASHFQLGYMRQDKSGNTRMQEEVEKQKWNPQSAVVKTNLAKSNFQLGSTTAFDGKSQNMNDFKNHGSAQFDPTAKAKRLELVNELRRSNLPAQHFDFPKSTAQESFAQSKSRADEAQAIKQRKEDADKIFARVRGVKPNFNLGSHKMDYVSENKGSMKEPSHQTVDKSLLNQQVATQRKHNFKMSFEAGNQFETAKGTNQSPYKLPGSSALADRVAKKGSSNVHQVQIGNSRTKNDYKSLTALQQSGHKQDSQTGQTRNAVPSFTEVRDRIAEQTKDLRSSHFALGVDKTPAQASSSVMFAAPPTKALLSGTADSKQARERIQKSNFTIKDVHGSRQPATTQSQANNQIRQGQWDKGQISKAVAVTKPIDSINFGQSCQYTSEAKSTFVGQGVQRHTGDPMGLKAKYTKPNINFGSSPNKDSMMTVAQANERAVNQQIDRQGLGLVNNDQKQKSKEFGSQMRSANFKMGSILPEHNGYRVSNLDRNNSGAIGLNKNQGSFAARPAQQQFQAQQVSHGNNIAKGHGSFKTVNQEFTGWIQPSAVAK